ncbi:hypothetical protein L218DRAFT_811027, partial [Marasmius fiardii PR-910]
TAKRITTNMAYIAQQDLNGYNQIQNHTTKRKRVFDRKVIESRQGEVTFKKGDLVQVYRREWDY